jgi:hypothetical protein
MENGQTVTGELSAYSFDNPHGSYLIPNSRRMAFRAIYGSWAAHAASSAGPVCERRGASHCERLAKAGLTPKLAGGHGAVGDYADLVSLSSKAALVIDELSSTYLMDLLSEDSRPAMAAEPEFSELQGYGSPTYTLTPVRSRRGHAEQDGLGRDCELLLILTSLWLLGSGSSFLAISAGVSNDQIPRRVCNISISTDHRTSCVRLTLISPAILLTGRIRRDKPASFFRLPRFLDIENSQSGVEVGR